MANFLGNFGHSIGQTLGNSISHSLGQSLNNSAPEELRVGSNYVVVREKVAEGNFKICEIMNSKYSILFYHQYCILSLRWIWSHRIGS